MRAATACWAVNLAADLAAHLAVIPQPAGRQKYSSSAPCRPAFGLLLASSRRPAGTARRREQLQDFEPAAHAPRIRHNRENPAAAANLWVRPRPSAATYRQRSRKTGCTRLAPRPNKARLQPQRTAWRP